jgi:small subunit ribosomal protein S6
LKKYEGMFLVDQEVSNKKWDEVIGHVRSHLEKHNAEILDLEKWNDLKLAYPIKKRKKATYILGHFNAEPSSIAPLRHDLQLSELVLRHLITVDTGRMQFLVEETPEAATRRPAEAEAAKPAATKEAEGTAEAAKPAAAKEAEKTAEAEKEKPSEGEGEPSEEKAEGEQADAEPAAAKEAEGTAEAEKEKPSEGEGEPSEEKAKGEQADAEPAETTPGEEQTEPAPEAAGKEPEKESAGE